MRMVQSTLPNRLAVRSKEQFYNVFDYFNWDEDIEEDRLWLPEDMLTTYGTPLHDSLTEQQLVVLSKWETVNLFSIFCIGEADLIREIIARVHRPYLDNCIEYLNHFVDEENKHMWFFRKFCEVYGGKVYDIKKIQVDGSGVSELMDFLAFMKVALFEEVGDLYNVAVIKSKSVPEQVRRIHKLHHSDEVGHILIGREISKELFQHLRETIEEDKLRSAVEYLTKYLHWIYDSLYNPSVYKDAGLKEEYKIRHELITHEERLAFRDRGIKKILSNYKFLELSEAA